MIDLAWDQVAKRANVDGEFRLAARFWNADLDFACGDVAVRLGLRDGVVLPERAEGDPDIRIAAPSADWSALLAPEPRPFFQDLWAAAAQHGFQLEGDLDSFRAYYPALRRLIEIARDVKADS